MGNISSFSSQPRVEACSTIISQRIYNYCLSRACIVENAFGILSNRFRVFQTALCLDADKVVSIVFVAQLSQLSQRSDTYVPPDYADSEDANHQLVEGAWRMEGVLNSVAMG